MRRRPTGCAVSCRRLDAPRRPAAHSAPWAIRDCCCSAAAPSARASRRAGAAWRERPAGVRPGFPASPPPPAGRGGQCRGRIAACDAAIVARQVPTHLPLAPRCCGAGRDLFLEKPATESAAEAACLAALAEGGGRIAQVGLYFRFPPEGGPARGMVAAGAFGRCITSPRASPGTQRARGVSGALLNDAVHFADLLPWIAGKPGAGLRHLADPLGRGREISPWSRCCSPRADGADRGRLRAARPLAGAVVPGAGRARSCSSPAMTPWPRSTSPPRASLSAAAPMPRRRRAPGAAARAEEELPVPAAGPVEVVAAELAAFSMRCAAAARPRPGCAAAPSPRRASSTRRGFPRGRAASSPWTRSRHDRAPFPPGRDAALRMALPPAPALPLRRRHRHPGPAGGGPRAHPAGRRRRAVGMAAETLARQIGFDKDPRWSDAAERGTQLRVP